eukprot:3352068-Rhodomonas_salina.1
MAKSVIPSKVQIPTTSPLLPYALPTPSPRLALPAVCTDLRARYAESSTEVAHAELYHTLVAVGFEPNVPPPPISYALAMHSPLRAI